MVHQRQGLALGLEPGNHLLGVHAQLDDLESDPPADRLGLLGHVHDAVAALADLLQQLVTPDPVPGLLGHLRLGSLRRAAPARPAERKPGSAVRDVVRQRRPAFTHMSVVGIGMVSVLASSCHPLQRKNTGEGCAADGTNSKGAKTRSGCAARTHITR